MDISKLPRLSQTNAPPPADEEAGPAGTAPLPVESGFPVMATAAPQAPAVYCNRCSAANAPGSRFCGACAAELRPPAGISHVARPTEGPGIGAEVWLSAIIGIVLMLFGMTFAQWAFTSALGGTYDTGMTWAAPVPGQPNQHPEGSPIGYWQLPGFRALQDMAIFLFGLAMVLEAIVLAVIHSRVRAKRPLLMFALSVTVLATVLNLLVSFKLIAVGLLPLMSLLAVGFGGYIAAYEWRLLQYFRPTPVARRA